MDFSLTDDQRMIRDNVRRFMDAEVRPNVRRYDREEKFADAEIRRLGELGCCGMLIPEEWGGAGLDTISYVLMLEEVARVDAAMAVALSVTNSVVAWLLYRHGTEAQRRKYLPATCARRDSRELLPHGSASRVGFGGLADARSPRRRHLPPRRRKDLGHQRGPERPLHHLCQDRSRRLALEESLLFSWNRLPRLSRQPLRR